MSDRDVGVTSDSNCGHVPAEFQRMCRLHVTAAEVCRAMVRASSRGELVESVVRTLVETGEFAMASFARLSPETQELVREVSWGDVTGYLDKIRIFADERPEGHGPAGTAFRSRQPYVCNDWWNDPRTLPWREAARSVGWAASAVFPVILHGEPRGLLTCYSLEKNFFGTEEVSLLEETVRDIAFGLERLDGEAELRTALAELEASERRLTLALDAAQMGTFELDLETGVVVWGGMHERLFGLAPGEFSGAFEEVLTRVHPDDREDLLQAVDAAKAGHSMFRVEFRVVWPCGTERWIYAQGEFVYALDGAALRRYGIVLDITDRKRAEELLFRNEERLRQAVRVANIGILDRDYVTENLYWSPEQRAILGFGQEEPATITGFLERVHPEDRERVLAAMIQAEDPAGDGTYQTAHRILLPDGKIRWLRTMVQVMFAGQGRERRPSRAVGATTDITEAVEAQAENRKLATIVENSRDCMGIATLDGRVTYLNDAGLRLLGVVFPLAESGRTINEFFPEEDAPFITGTVLPALFNNGYWSGELRLKNQRTGEPIDAELTTFMIRDQQGRPISHAMVSRDIRERKRTEAERIELEQQLFQAQKMESIGRLAGGVAHDFNNMLTVINGHSQMLLAKLNPMDPIRSQVSEINKAGERAAGLTRQLLTMSRKQVMQTRELDLNKLVADMQPMLMRLVGEDFDLRVVAQATAAMVNADPHQLEQVVLNLVVNARDAMPNGGRLVIETANPESVKSGAPPRGDNGRVDYILLAVSDTGTGMEETTRQRIFEPFFTTKPLGQGTGLGLSTVQGVVTQSGGHLDVYSEPGRGSTFKVYLPILPPEGNEPREPEDKTAAAGGKETILVVEDEPEVRQFTVQALESYGYNVIEANDGEEGLEICRQMGDVIDLVVTDVVMPRMSGRELANRAWRMLPEMKFLFMSGYTDNALSMNGVLEPHVRFIEKPFSLEGMAKRVREVLGPVVVAVRILVADDDPEVREFLRAALEQGGYAVVEAEDGRRAMEVLMEGGIDLVLMDLVMPGQEGIETIQEIRKEMPDTRIIAISGGFGGQFLGVAKMLGADATLEKPIAPSALLEKVGEVLQLRRDGVHH